ncbi:MATE family efflux transporter [Trichlorobacter ammonificans]|uniref:Multidrug-efflux transporter n=1 Tax=Trichlorobacter ammonificans TaxID=2916410 RepID=A0ABM9D6C0_9BACT|nr:MATE family efflux transporter [Trichlorobacter ammonificans]CAH2029971.1 Putative efflux protein, MATE family [Trichlorobacter ammonificans]
MLRRLLPIGPAVRSKPVSIRSSVFKLSLPVLLSSLFQRLVGIADIFMTGGLGASAIAATGLGQLLMFCTMTIFWGLSTGATVVIAHLTGAGRHDEARRAAVTAFLACLGLTVICSVAGTLWGGEAARLLGATSEVQAQARDYIRLVFQWLLWTTGVNILSAIMHGNGQTRIPMQGILLVNILHILIAWPLIYGKLGLPPLGVKGAAIAINLSEAIGCCYLLIQAFRHRYLGLLRPQAALFGRIWRVGWPVALERVAQQSGQLFYSGFIIAYGTTAYAAHQIGLSIESLSFMPGAGMGIAAATLMGQSLGAKKYRRARAGHGEAMKLALVVMGSMALLFLAIPHHLVSLFTADPEVIRQGSVFLRLVAFAQVPLALSFVYAGSLRGAGDTFYVFLVTMLTMWGVRVLLAWIVSSWLQLSLYWVWGVFLVDWYVRALAFGWRYHRRDLHGVSL